MGKERFPREWEELEQEMEIENYIKCADITISIINLTLYLFRGIRRKMRPKILKILNFKF